MTIKKSSKDVLDYDPLAWLNEADEEPQGSSEDTAEQDESSRKQKTGNTKKTSSVKTRTIKKSAPKKAAAKKRPEPKKTPEQQTEAESTGEADDGGAAFGFFADDETETATDEEQQSYGFFDPADQQTGQIVELDESENVIDLGAELTLRTVSACKVLIDDALSSGFDVKIAAGDLQKIDTAGLQLIYSLKSTLEKNFQSIHWVSSNSIINESARILGLPKLVDSSEDEEAYGFFGDDVQTEIQTNQQDDSSFGFF